MVTEYEQKVVDNVARYGWHCTMVGAGEGEPEFAYTVGLWETLCTPDLIVFGLNLKLMHAMLDEMVIRLREGAELFDGARWSGIIQGFDCISRPVHPSRLSTRI